MGEWVGGFGCHCMAVATAIQWKHGIVWARRGAPCMARLGGWVVRAAARWRATARPGHGAHGCVVAY